MENILIIAVVIIVAYSFGLFSSARVVAKTFKYLNIAKVGSGHLDTKNIYLNVSKSLGVLVALLDITKMYLFMWSIHYLFSNVLNIPIIVDDYNLMFVYGFFVIIGHCFPFYNHFKGGRGIFTFVGYIGFFAPITMLITGIGAAIISLVFGQHRFAKYFTIGTPVVFSLIVNTIKPYISDFHQSGVNLTTKILIASILMIIVNFIVSRNRVKS